MGGASPEKPLPDKAKGIPGIQQGTPAWIEVNRSSDLARGRAAALPTFHHDCRDAIATAAIRLNRMKHLEPKFPDFKYLAFETSATERRIGDFNRCGYPSHLRPLPRRAVLQAVCVASN